MRYEIELYEVMNIYNAEWVNVIYASWSSVDLGSDDIRRYFESRWYYKEVANFIFVAEIEKKYYQKSSFVNRFEKQVFHAILNWIPNLLK